MHKTKWKKKLNKYLKHSGKNVTAAAQIILSVGHFWKDHDLAAGRSSYGSCAVLMIGADHRSGNIKKHKTRT